MGDGSKPPERDHARRNGFLLAEVLVALVLAGLFLGVLGQAFSLAWATARTPMDVVSAITIARALLADADDARRGNAGQIGSYAFARSFATVNFETRPSSVAPAPRGAPSSAPPNEARPDAPVFDLRSTTIVIRSPTGRKVRLESVGLHAP